MLIIIIVGAEKKNQFNVKRILSPRTERRNICLTSNKRPSRRVESRDEP